MRFFLTILFCAFSINALALTHADIPTLCGESDDQVVNAIAAAYGVFYKSASPQEKAEATKLFSDPGFVEEVKKDMAIHDMEIPKAVSYVRYVCTQQP